MGLHARPAGKVHIRVLDRAMERGRRRNKPLPWGRDKHLLFHEGMAIALQIAGNERKRKEETVKGSQMDSESRRHKVHDSSALCNAQFLTITMPDLTFSSQNPFEN